MANEGTKPRRKPVLMLSKSNQNIKQAKDAG
jgi:hypothetical protein